MSSGWFLIRKRNPKCSQEHAGQHPVCPESWVLPSQKNYFQRMKKIHFMFSCSLFSTHSKKIFLLLFDLHRHKARDCFTCKHCTRYNWPGSVEIVVKNITQVIIGEISPFFFQFAIAIHLLRKKEKRKIWLWWFSLLGQLGTPEESCWHFPTKDRGGLIYCSTAQRSTEPELSVLLARGWWSLI